MSTSRTLRTIINLALLGLVVWLFFNYQNLLDQYALAHYQPTSDISAYLGRVQLSDSGKAILYRSNPSIDNKAAFNSDCQTTVGELELGCFSRGKIFILRIDNADLAPEMDVVASHELLHAIWDRMSISERSSLAAELERVYGTIADDDLKARIASYAKSEPGQQDNELHSILGTEFANLSPTLEAHYAKYFIHRTQVVARHETYKGVFATRRAQLDAELGLIRSLKAQLAQINSQMEAEKRAGNIAAYNALVPRQNKLVNDVNSRITAYRAAVDEYNALSVVLDSQQIQPGE